MKKSAQRGDLCKITSLVRSRANVRLNSAAPGDEAVYPSQRLPWGRWVTELSKFYRCAPRRPGEQQLHGSGSGPALLLRLRLRVLPREHGEGHWDLAGSVVERVFSGGFQEDTVPAWSPEGGVEGDDLDYLWQKLTSDQRPNCCLL